MANFEVITSRDNRRLIHARRVRDGGTRDLIFIEGKRLVAEAMSAGLEIEECFVADGFDDIDLVEAIVARASLFSLSDNLFKSIADTKSPQGIIAVAKRPSIGVGGLDDSVFQKAGSIVVFLKDVNNPANLGAILRTAEAAGSPVVITSPDSADAFSPKSLRASMGSAFRLKIEQGMTLSEAAKWARERGMRVVGTDPEKGRAYTENDWARPSLVVFGSEAHGFTIEEIAKCDESVRIPIAAGVESLNLAVSAGVILFEAKRQSS